MKIDQVNLEAAKAIVAKSNPDAIFVAHDYCPGLFRIMDFTYTTEFRVQIGEYDDVFGEAYHSEGNIWE